MDKWQELFGQFLEIDTGHGNLAESFLQMNAENLDASGLDDNQYALVRLAGLIAVDGPIASYEGVLELGKESGLTFEQVAGVLIALAPVVGGPRVLAAAAKLNEAGDELLS